MTNQIVYSTSSLPNLTGNDLEGVIATTDYQTTKILEKALHLFKYNRVRQLGVILASLMRVRVKIFFEKGKNINRSWLIIPVPLHRRKNLERGFNQNDILAINCFKPFPQALVLTGKQNPLKRSRYTGSQTKLSGKQRVKNVQDAFFVADPKIIANKNIIIVDDVITTGSTIKEVARCLKSADAREIWGLVLTKD